MLIVSDIHGAFESLARVASRGEPLLVLGDFLNVIDYRTMDGMLVDVLGHTVVADIVERRARADHDGANRAWRAAVAGSEEEVRRRFHELTVTAYETAAAALAGSDAIVTYGNVDRPDLLEASLPDGVRFVEVGVVEVEGRSVGIVGGGVPGLGTPGEVPHEVMRERLFGLGEVDILCTHVAPAVPQLSLDVVGGRPKQSQAVLDYLLRFRPGWHYFGDIHQPQAVRWRVGGTVCRNVGYFRATGRAVRHG
ncbi:MAG TPA: metallophosphoesterase family protein [Acidimicrobiia bacterium]|nr:metallophosphoesterase family protein [Acidimicrobiia bacterium]